MSTFDGIVKEFPDIRIDYFRSSNGQSQPPLALFLSHVHSDHLVGLESCKSPFIYCSPATRELLLRLEKYPHRMNFAKGILESRKQTYRHLKTLLKPIPLETPTKLELSPGRTIRVTLFDANHCVGAVAFLIEDDKKAIVYTGDIRSEAWLIDTWCRHPLLIPYVCSGKRKPLKRLDCVYLDTTFAQKADPYREFPSKAEGLTEILMAVSRYPQNTLFYFDSWTFGYEDVWQTLAAALNSQIHLDHYRGVEMAELGAGGGQGDLGQHHELEVWDPSLVGQLIALCASKLHGQPELQASVMQMLTSIIEDRIPSISLDDSELKEESIQNEKGEEGFTNLDDLPLERLVSALAKLVTKAKGQGQKEDRFTKDRSSVFSARADGLPKQITFPYSRHSSYSELCRLVEAFKPVDIHPCTVEKAKWTSAHSMNFLFGHIYGSDAPSFHHDQIMLARIGPSTPALATTSGQPLAGEVSTDDRVAPDETHSCEKNPGEQDRSHKRRRRDDSLSSHRRKGRECSDLDDDHDAHVAAEAALQNQTSSPKVSARHDHLESPIEGAEGSSADLTNQDAGIDSKLESVRDFARPDTRHPPLPLTTNASSDEGTAKLVRADDDQGVADYPSDLLDEAQSKPSNARNLLLRQEAYDAAMSVDVLRWDDVSLASRSSHQVREEEL
ncbi:hypothetical protein KC333_g6212 [Hortaea werneckii]|nr:hypothetical protein KC333_g6212 [Hortaea werneckii]KAI7311819.1 hypothetical protein KC326_g6134 [Hortaea werneckii]